MDVRTVTNGRAPMEGGVARCTLQLDETAARTMGPEPAAVAGGLEAAL